MSKPIHKKLDLQEKELTAQVERLRNAAFGILMNRTGMDEWYALEKVYRETPPDALAALKAEWQVEIISELKIHMMNNGYGDEADGVGAWFEERQRAQEAGDE